MSYWGQANQYNPQQSIQPNVYGRLNTYPGVAQQAQLTTVSPRASYEYPQQLPQGQFYGQPVQQQFATQQVQPYQQYEDFYEDK